MKKAFLIFFVLVAAIGACFATSGDKLTLTTSVAKENPEFQIIGKYNSEVKPGPHTFTVNSPAENDIVLTVAIKQSNDARFIGAKKLTITATPIACTDAGMTDQTTGLPSIGEFEPTGKPNVTASKKIDSATGKVTIDLVYTGTLVNGYEIASWAYTWTAVTSLAPGNYQGTVTLEYSAN